MSASRRGAHLLEIKPTFHPILMLLRTLARSGFSVGFFTIWGGGFFGAFGAFGLGFFLGRDPESFMPGIFFITAGISFLLACLSSIIWYFTERETYANRKVTFYEDEIEFVDGFFNKQRKIIPAKNVREVVINQGWLQTKYNVGTLLFITAANEGGTGSSGINLKDVENPEAVYDQIRDTLNL